MFKSSMRALVFGFCVLLVLVCNFIFGLAWFLLLCGIFSGCGEQKLLSSHGLQISLCSGFSL